MDGGRFVVGRPEIVEAHLSEDGTRKWLLRSADGQDYEMVFIPDDDRGTLCISSQVGCTLKLPFLPHRHHAAGPQFDPWRNSRAGDAGT